MQDKTSKPKGLKQDTEPLGATTKVNLRILNVVVPKGLPVLVLIRLNLVVQVGVILYDY